MVQVFISYARDVKPGEQLAFEMQVRLQDAGLSVFRDVIGIDPGDEWVKVLEDNLVASQVVVLIVSEKVRRSKWVHNEIDLAQARGIPVIPVLAESVELPLWLRHLQVADFSVKQDWDELIADVSERLEYRTSEYPVSPASSKAPFSMEFPLRGVQGDKPVWSDVSGEDEFGRFADLVVGSVVQRMRWIEGVNDLAAFWVADTACTQALWLEVMGKNPAEFSSDLQRPVEQVSWLKTQDFLEQLNARVSGLKARLPTGSEWELACRAGIDTAYVFGDRVTREQVNFSGEGTVVVKSLPANSWGLYEVHGNVWEWCDDDADEWGNLKVLRGGCWANEAKFVRADSRGQSAVGNRDYTIGFRFVSS